MMDNSFFVSDVGSGGICGNGIFESASEECDCGVNNVNATASEIAACLAADPCCDYHGCTLKAGMQCRYVCKHCKQF